MIGDHEIHGCNCGKVHHLPDDVPVEYVEGTVEVQVMGQRFKVLVPRVWIAFHGVRAQDLVMLANLWNWTEVS